ncbi:hypothetical protein ACR77J_11890 [Tissierella praeacuta]|uniref:hypothetical protein n=1 Tax=Tissierella praeacuta TaxID=43131 RepID=UPI001044F310|nr:hypothetical protein [Tissierella praeacuta]TCU72824.1 hypothetical protein EV204_105160 [Tissierella praeacuta]
MENIVADSIKQGFYYGIEFWLKIFFEFTIPRIAPYIVGTIVVGIIAYIATKIVSNFSIMIGDTSRETRRKVKTTRNLIDLFSALNDIWPKKK